MNYTKKFFGHLKTITTHKIKVTKLCFKVGLYKQGILHDMSKYMPSEFLQGVKYYEGYRSPIAKEREINGYSNAWLHHKGRNKHHYEYYFDRNKQGIIFIEMPYNYLIEMVIDRIAACQTYEGDKFTNASCNNYYRRVNDGRYMHPNTKKQLEFYLNMIEQNGVDFTLNYIKKTLIKNN